MVVKIMMHYNQVNPTRIISVHFQTWLPTALLSQVSAEHCHAAHTHTACPHKTTVPPVQMQN